MTPEWNELAAKFRELNDLASAIKLLHWDQAVMMPPSGGASRARAIATLEASAHARLVEPRVGELIETLSSHDSLDGDQRASLRVLRRDYERAVRLPEDLVRAIAEASGRAYQTWTEARPAADFRMLEEDLSRLIGLKKQEADALGWEVERYDALLDEFEPGMKTSEVALMFEELTSGLKPLADEVLAVVDERPVFLSEDYEPSIQEELCKWLVERLHFDVRAGRLDSSPHPFTIPIGAGDVRQTTRADRNDLLMSVYAAIHETGHALYEQGLPPEMLDLPIGRFASLGMHESQSRLWENHVGRSRSFTSFLLPHLKERFPEQLGLVNPDDFYRAVNYPQRTLIRVTADELTYNLHVGFRFELERAIFNDELEPADLPSAWNESVHSHLGIRPPHDGDGVLQDMHWSIGSFGYFPTYTLGTIYAAGIFSAAEKQLGDLDEEMRAGETERLLAWLRDKIHRHGYRYDAKALAEDVVGGPVTAAPLLDYLDAKYRDLYLEAA